MARFVSDVLMHQNFENNAKSRIFITKKTVTNGHVAKIVTPIVSILYIWWRRLGLTCYCSPTAQRLYRQPNCIRSCFSTRL